MVTLWVKMTYIKSMKERELKRKENIKKKWEKEEDRGGYFGDGHHPKFHENFKVVN